jgi:hypothetical protein
LLFGLEIGGCLHKFVPRLKLGQAAYYCVATIEEVVEVDAFAVNATTCMLREGRNQRNDELVY